MKIGVEIIHVIHHLIRLLHIQYLKIQYLAHFHLK
nr:MAG TPA: hypothetical protein [Bacteriophage sp.]